MAKRTKVPRASIACTILDDPDYMGLSQTPSGRDAFALFCALLAAAKAQDNRGVFKHPAVVVAAMIRWPVADYTAALATLCADTNWVTCDAQLLTIRSFKKWNSWGGERDGAGRKPRQTDVPETAKVRARNVINNAVVSGRLAPASKVQCAVCGDPADEYHHPDYLKPEEVVPLCNQHHAAAHSSANQTGIKQESNVATPVSVTVSVTDTTKTTTLPGKAREAKAYPASFEEWWALYPRLIRDGKGKAAKVWGRLAEQDQQAAQRAVVVFAEIVNSAPPDRQTGFKRPEAWLNAASWETDPEVWRAHAKPFGAKTIDRATAVSPQHQRGLDAYGD